MSNLGYLMWWKVGDVDLDYDRLKRALRGTGLDMPARPLPQDVFRRITGPRNTLDAVVPGGILQLSMVAVTSASKKMSNRHMVGTLKDEKGVNKLVRKVGDVAFHAPPKGQHDKARLQVVTAPPIEEWREPVEYFAGLIRREYDAGLKGALDSQAVRRLIRSYLARINALYLDGPYLVQDAAAVEATLAPLFRLLGAASFMHSVPMPDDAKQREFLRRGVQRAVDADTDVGPALLALLD